MYYYKNYQKIRFLLIYYFNYSSLTFFSSIKAILLYLQSPLVFSISRRRMQIIKKRAYQYSPFRLIIIEEVDNYIAVIRLRKRFYH